MIIKRNNVFQVFKSKVRLKKKNMASILKSLIELLEDVETTEFDKIENIIVLLENHGIGIISHDF